MSKYEWSNSLFINPYNFVPVNLKKTPRSDITQQKENLFTGYFECRIKCRTPLAIPDVSRATEIEDKHFYYPFFSIDGQKPVIPGSSIRGVIRSAYETITDSCFGSMQKDTKITARTKDAFQPGLLKRQINNGREEWILYSAKRHLLVVDSRFYSDQNLDNRINLYNADDLQRTGDEVKFNLISNGKSFLGYTSHGREIGKYANIDPKGTRTGYLCIGEKAPKRHFQSIFEADKAVGRAKKEDFPKLEAILQVYRDDKINRMYKDKRNSHKGYSDYEYAKSKGVIPIYYQQNANKRYITFAALGRKVFNKTLNEKAGEKSHQHCNSRKNLCAACALFGTAEDEKVGSRIRFTDAECCNFTPELIHHRVTFAELGSPRMSYFPFYLKESNANYKVNYSEGYDSQYLEIRGRKFYWHHVPDLNGNVEKNQRNATFDLVDTDAEFKFRIYFENLLKEEIQLLFASITLNENNVQGEYCHKIGHGKPLGFGSVKITVAYCKIRKYESAAEGKKWIEEDYPLAKEEYFKCDPNTYEALRYISNFNALRNDDAVRYPKVLLDNNYERMRNQLKPNILASHQWFTTNYRLGNARPQKKLPEILDREKYLYDIQATNIDVQRDTERGNHHGGNNRQINNQRRNQQGRRNNQRRNGH